MNTDTVTYPAPCQSSASALPVYAPFILLIRWMLGWAMQEAAEQGERTQPAFKRRHHWRYMSRSYNRKERRTPARKIAGANNLRVFYSLIEQTDTKSQFIEKIARLSSIGRIAIYGFRYWHKKRLSMTKLTPFDFGGWNAPMSANHADGFWDAQALPDWLTT